MADTVIGVISDTHGESDDWFFRVFRENGVSSIMHAGDAGSRKVIKALRVIAPVACVRGNMDDYDIGQTTFVHECGDCSFYILHDLYRLDIDPAAAGMNAVIHGHTHRADIEWKDRTLYLNPGSACFPRGDKPASVALLEINNNVIVPRIVFKD